MSDFLDRTLELQRAGKISENDEEYREVFRIRAELEDVNKKSFLPLDNIETLFGAVEMGRIIGKLPNRPIEEINRLRELIITLIVRTLELSIPFPVSDQHIYPPPPYDDFAKVLKKLVDEQKDFKSSIITFNYDLALDYSMHHQGIPYDYYLIRSPDEENRELPFLKLHGSINWGVCPVCKAIVPRFIQEANFHIFPDTKQVYYDLGSKISQKSHCDEKPLQGPLLVPPTWNKTDYQKDVANVWKRAARDLSEAENIIVIGYSLPETDLFFRYLYAIGTESRTILRKFWVFDPDESVEIRFQKLIGQGIKNRFSFKKMPFIEAIRFISNNLLRVM